MNIKRILLPVDLSDASGPAAERAAEIARMFKAKIIVMHVTDEAEYEKEWFYEGLADSVQETLAGQRETLRRLDRIFTRQQRRGLDIETLVAYGKPCQSILDASEELKVDLIIMGTHGRRGISHLLLGSVAEKVVRLAMVPVMTVKAGAGAMREEFPTAQVANP